MLHSIAALFAGVAWGLGFAIAIVSLFVRALEGKRIELSTTKSVDMFGLRDQNLKGL